MPSLFHLAVLAKAACAFKQAWVANISAPLLPLSVGVSTASSSVIVGTRNCPDNTESSGLLFSLHSGSLEASVDGLSQLAVPKSATSPAAAGAAWDKHNATTLASFQSGPQLQVARFSTTLPGESAFGAAAAVTAKGELSAFLLEPPTDPAHTGNRSSLLVVKSANGSTCFSKKVEGQGSTFPMWVSIAAHSYTSPTSLSASVGSASGSSGVSAEFTVAATLGEGFLVASVDAVACTGTVLMGIATGLGSGSTSVSGDGSLVVAVSQDNVQVFGRKSKRKKKTTEIANAADTDDTTDSNKAKSGGDFKELFSIAPPAAGYIPLLTQFDAVPPASSMLPLLAIAWGDQQGAQLAVTAHSIDITNGTQTLLWQYDRNCPQGGDYTAPGSLAVSSLGEFVAFGTWGCGSKKPAFNMVVLQGRGGAGLAPLLQAHVPGQIWAVDVEGGEENAGGGAVAVAAAWPEDAAALSLDARQRGWRSGREFFGNGKKDQGGPPPSVQPPLFLSPATVTAWTA